MKKLSLLFTLVLTIGIFVNANLVDDGYQVGDKVDAKVATMSMKDVDGKMKSIKDLMGENGAIVVFTCNHCPFAVASEDRIIALDKEYKAKGFPVIAINPNEASHPDDDYQDMIARAKEKGFTFPYLADKSQKITKTFGATKTPHFYLIDKGMTVQYIGAMDDNVRDASAVDKTYLADAVNMMLKGEKPQVTETKAVGCTIKWLKQ